MTRIVTSTYRYKRPPRGMSGDNLDGLSAAVTAWAVGERLVRRIYLFGSRAKGTARPDSDIDLAILHDIDPEVASTCHPPEDAHMWTWMVHSERWIAELQSRVGQVHVQQVDRESRKIVVPALKECRLCLYRRVSMLLIAAWLATVGQAFGFEVDGYRSGLSLAEVQHHAGQLSRITPNSETYVMMTPSGPVGPSFTFCDGKLAMYGQTLHGGFPAFNRILERESTRRGPGLGE
jgi:hypothetical protein